MIAAGDQMGVRDLHRCGGGEVRREDRGRGDGCAVLGGNKREIERAAGFDPTRDPRGDEPRRRRDTHG